MDWKKLLDFRIGRANRGQFWLYGGICLSPVALYIVFPSLVYFVIPLIFLGFYPFIILCVRRIHDLGLSGAGEMKSVTICPDPILHDTLLGNRHHHSSIIDYRGYLPVLFQKGQELENAYGFPPEGLGLNSMIAQDYSKKQKAKPIVSEYINYKNNKDEIMKNAFETKEFKGRDL